MTISSRTPEGQPTSCPLCSANVVVEPSVFIGDATCPRCGQLLWFIQTSEATRIFDVESSGTIRDRIIGIVANQLAVDHTTIPNNASLFGGLAADSLDIVELVMEVEEECDLS